MPVEKIKICGVCFYMHVYVSVFINVHLTNILICQFYHSCQESTYRYDSVNSSLFSMKWKKINQITISNIRIYGGS